MPLRENAISLYVRLRETLSMIVVIFIAAVQVLRLIAIHASLQSRGLDAVINEVALQGTGHVVSWPKLLNFPMLIIIW